MRMEYRSRDLKDAKGPKERKREAFPDFRDAEARRKRNVRRARELLEFAMQRSQKGTDGLGARLIKRHYALVVFQGGVVLPLGFEVLEAATLLGTQIGGDGDADFIEEREAPGTALFG